MKRAISLLLSLLLVISALPVCIISANAENAVMLSMETVSATPGSTVEVNVNISGNTGIASMGLNISFDECLTLVGAANGEAFSELTMTPPNQLKKGGSVTGSCRFAWLGNDNATEDGTILSLQFEVADNAQLNKNCMITLYCEEDDVLDNARNAVEVITTAGKIVIIDYIPGDVNDNGTINMLDVLTLCQYYVDGCQYDPEGYAVTIKEPAGDVDANGKINMLDVLMVCQYYVDGCQYDPEGYAVKLLPGKVKCPHEMTATAAKTVTCTENGNIAYWYCSVCDKFFSDQSGNKEISLEETVIAAKGHTAVVDPAVAPTETSVGYTEGSHCSVCNEVLVAQEEIPMLKPQTASITYRLVNNDDYLAAQEIINPNPETYVIGKGLTLSNDISVPGYTFVGWFDSFDESATRIRTISASETENITLFAHWKVENYTITFDSPLVPCASVSYKVNTGITLTNPSLAGYNFIGWCDENDQLVTSIPKGTTGNKILYANWTSKRNQTRPVSKLGDPLIFEDTDSGQILFAYEIGTIENVPLSQISDIYQSTSGMKQTFTTSEQTSVTESNAKSIANSISNATTSSSAWSLSADWNDVVSVNESYATEQGWSQEEAETNSKTSSDTYSINSSHGGASSTVTSSGLSGSLSKSHSNTSGSTSSETHEKGSEYELKDGMSVKGSAGVDKFGVKAEVEVGFDISETNKNSEKDATTDTLSSSETGARSRTLSGDYSKSTTGSSSWNSSSGYSSSNSTSSSISISNVISGAINESKGYGSSYAKGGSQNDSQSFANSETESREYSTSVTYSSATTKTNTKSIELGGENEGYYRFVLAGTAHVFAIVGYDVASSSYYTYTYSVMDDNTYTFIDYSKNTPNFDDCENGVLPFEIPYFVKEYVDDRILKTSDLQINPQTGIIEAYTGEDTIVFIPAYISVENIDGNGKNGFVVVRGISEAVFKNRIDIVGVSLENFITEIPANAFSGCSSIEAIVCPGVKVIGENAFNGCTSLGEFEVPLAVESVGHNAFKDVEKVVFTASNENIAEQAVNCGAKQIVLNISNIPDKVTDSVYEVPESTEYFELQGGNKSFENIAIESYAQTTYLNGINDACTSCVPLVIASENLTLNGVNVSNNGFGMALLNEDTRIALRQENTINSTSGKAIVCKNLTLTPATTGITSRLNVSGDIYVCGEITGIEYLNITNGEIKYIDEATYEKYLIGTFAINFDANGGSVTETSKTAYCYSPIGTLPTPTRQYYTFDGWFTAKDGGTRVTAETVFDDVKDVTLYAHWTLNSFIVTFNANSGSVSPTTLRAYCGQKLGTLPTPTRTGFAFNGWYTSASGGTQVTADSTYSTANDFTVYAHWTCNSYTASWSTGTGYSISVNRTSSPNGGASTGNISSGSKIYYGDVLSITYTASTGYSLGNKGKTSITVSGDVTSSDVFASASVNSYTYNVVYKSSNGTSLGSTTVTKNYGTTNTITAPAKSGYNTPSSQSVQWDSTSAKTITFVYSPSSVNSTNKTGTISSSPNITYSATMEYRNRTANSVEVRIVWTGTIAAKNGDIYEQRLSASTNAGSSSATVVAFNGWAGYTSGARSSTGTTGWMKVNLSTTNATTASVYVHYCQYNSLGADMHDYDGTDHLATNWSMNIPAY